MMSDPGASHRAEEVLQTLEKDLATEGKRAMLLKERPSTAEAAQGRAKDAPPTMQKRGAAARNS